MFLSGRTELQIQIYRQSPETPDQGWSVIARSVWGAKGPWDARSWGNNRSSSMDADREWYFVHVEELLFEGPPRIEAWLLYTDSTTNRSPSQFPCRGGRVLCYCFSLSFQGSEPCSWYILVLPEQFAVKSKWTWLFLPFLAASGFTPAALTG